MTFEPRKIFRASQIKGWGDLVVSNQFELAVLSAMTAMQMELPLAETEHAAAANHYRMEGARQFLRILRNLAESEIQSTKPTAVNLNHKA